MSSIVRQRDFKGGRAINAILPRHAFEQRPLSSAYKEARESRFTGVLPYAGQSFGSACHDVVAKPERRARTYEEVDGKIMHFQEIQPGEVVDGPTFTIDRDEMVEFAKRWDPQPFHIDDEAGNAAFGGITAPGVFLLAVKIRLLHQLPEPLAVIAGLGYDELRFHAPARPGDELQLRQKWLDKRVRIQTRSWNRQLASVNGQPRWRDRVESPRQCAAPTPRVARRHVVCNSMGERR